MTALNQDDIGALRRSARPGSGTVAIQISAAVHVMTANVSAYIGDGAKVNQGDDAEGAGQSVLVAAANDYQHLGVAGGAAVSGVVGITPGVEVTVVTNTVQAYIGEDALVEAQARRRGARAARPRTSSRSRSRSPSAALVGIGGAVAVLVVDNTTYAYVGDGAQVRAGGNVLVTAADDTDVDIVAIGAGIGIGAAGIGAGVGVSVLTKDTRAWIGDAHRRRQGRVLGDHRARRPGRNRPARLRRLAERRVGVFGHVAAGSDVRGVAVVAQSREDVLAIAIAGAGGLGAGIAGAVTVSVIDSDTRAYIDGGAADQHRHRTRTPTRTSTSRPSTTSRSSRSAARSASASPGSPAASTSASSTTTRRPSSPATTSARSATCASRALADRETESYAISVGGGVVGLGAAVCVYALGGNLVATYAYDDDGTTRVEGLADATPTGRRDVDEHHLERRHADPGQRQARHDQRRRLGRARPDRRHDPAAAPGTTHNSGDIRGAATSAQDVVRRRDAEQRRQRRRPPPPAPTIVGSQTVPRGTTAFIGRNADVTAGRDVDLDARERVDLTDGRRRPRRRRRRASARASRC